MTGVVVTQSLEHVEPHRCLMFKCSYRIFNGMDFSMQHCAVSDIASSATEVQATFLGRYLPKPM